MLIKTIIDKLRKNNSDSKHKDAQQPGELIDKRQRKTINDKLRKSSSGTHHQLTHQIKS